MSLVTVPAAIIGFILALLLLIGTFLTAVPPAAAAFGLIFPLYVVVLALCYVPAAIAGAFPATLGLCAMVFTVVLFFVGLGAAADLLAAATVALTASGIAAGATAGASQVPLVTLLLLAVFGLLANAVIQILLIGLFYHVADLVLWLSPPTVATGPVTIDAASTELNMRGTLLGINGFVNLMLAILTYPVACIFLFNPGLGIVVAVLTILFVMAASLGTLYRSAAGVVQADVRSALGWSVWLMPSAWPMEVLGILFYAASLLLHPLSCLFVTCAPTLANFLRVTGLAVRRDTGTIVMTGGLAANLGIGGLAYNLATFVFVRTASLTGAAPGPFPESGLQHETGHHLNVAAFGSYFHLIGWLNEGMHVLLSAATAALPTGPVTVWQRAYAEQLATTNVTAAPARTVAGFTTPLRMWG